MLLQSGATLMAQVSIGCPPTGPLAETIMCLKEPPSKLKYSIKKIVYSRSTGRLVAITCAYTV